MLPYRSAGPLKTELVGSNRGSCLEYPMLWESEYWDMDPYAVELNRYVDTILDVIFQCGAGRDILFHSFSPEICILMSLKQQKYPVLFANDAGNTPVGDLRAGNLQEAIQFTKRWNLPGLVMASEPFVMCPRLLGYTKSSGIKCASYGVLNDDPECAKVRKFE
jgi:glycerophosphodiester phosphodiesterase